MPNRALIIACFACTYIIWGSTYMAIKLVIEDVPPFISIGGRFFFAGLLMYSFALLQKARMPSLVQWGNALFLGTLFMAIGTGAVAWAEQYVDTGIAALIISAEPLIILLMVWILFQQRPSRRSLLGVGLGVLGIILLVSQSGFATSNSSYAGVIAILTAMIAWAIASIYSPSADLPKSKIQASAMQMIMGGLMQISIGLLLGESATFSIYKMTNTAWMAWGYLVVFGSIIGFSAFNYLLQHIPPEKVATSTYVNPIVALFLGWYVLNEVLTIQSLVACGVLGTGVFFVNTAKKNPSLKIKQQEQILRWKMRLGGWFKK